VRADGRHLVESASLTTPGEAPAEWYQKGGPSVPTRPTAGEAGAVPHPTW